MKIPTQLKILANQYQVFEVDGESIDKCSGEQNNARSTIKIRRDMPQSQKEVTLFHEILHAINVNLEEKDVEFLAQTIYCVLKENNLLK